MNFDSHLQNSDGDDKRLPNGLTAADIAALSHYPSLDKLFHDPDLSTLLAMKNKLHETFQNIERVVLRGSASEAKRAQTAAISVKSALDFLAAIEQANLNKTDS